MCCEETKKYSNHSTVPCAICSKPYSGLVVVYKRIFTIGIFLLLLITESCGQSWNEQPQDTDIPLGGKGTVKCSFNNIGGNLVQWSKVTSGGDITLFMNNSRIDQREQHQHISLEDTPDKFNLVFDGSKTGDDSEYRCMLTSTELKKTVQVTILAAPGQPTQVSLNNTDPREGQIVELQCDSTGGNPTPSVKWFRETDDITQGSTVVPPSEKFGTTVTRKTWQLSRDDNGKTFKCQFEVNRLQNAKSEQSRQLNVKYKPVLSFNATNPHKQVSGTDMYITCQSDANPAPTLTQWKKAGVLQGSSEVLTKSPLGVNDKGTYECSVTNEVDTTSQTIAVDVLYKPVVTISNPGPVKEGESILLRCSVDANPSPNSIQWKRGSSVVHTGTDYDITGITRQQAGQYVCEATNTMSPSGGSPQQGQGQATTEVVVQYVPGVASITDPGSKVIGDSVIMTCTLDDPGVPSATFEWKKPWTPTIETGPVLTMNNLVLNQNGEYTCHPKNSVGYGTNATRLLNINEPAGWMPNGQLPQDKVTNISNTGVSVQCQVRGRPKPTVTWYKDNVQIQTGTLYTIQEQSVDVDTWSKHVTSTLSWKGSGRVPEDSLRREDTGSYRCKAQNEANSVNIESEMNLVVQYAPAFQTGLNRVATDMNDSVALHCYVRAEPAPQFEWYNGSQRLQTGGRTLIYEVNQDGTYKHGSILNITDVYPYDLGDYTCRAQNIIGSASTTVHLTVKTPPETPTEVQIIERTWESVQLSWKPGFNGGYEQTFKVCYNSPGMPEKWVPVEPSFATTYNVTSLYPSTNYTFWIVGENILGYGDYSKNVSTQTSELIIGSPTEVKYDATTRTLTFRAPSSNYCARIELSKDGENWRTYKECASTLSPVVIQEGEDFDHLRVSFCLLNRPDVCSTSSKADIIKPVPDVPVSTIIIVACVCGAIVLILLAILIFLCIRKRRLNTPKKYDDNSIRKPPSTSNSRSSTENGIVNAGMDDVDLDDRRRVFTVGNHANGHIPNHDPYVYYDNDSKRSYIGDYPPPPYNGYESYQNLKNTELEHPDSNMYNPKHRRKPPTEMMYLEDPDAHNLSSHSSHGHRDPPESGYSTPDPTRPKKIIHEVVV